MSPLGTKPTDNLHLSSGRIGVGSDYSACNERWEVSCRIATVSALFRYLARHPSADGSW